MASRTIKISSIPENCTEQDIKNALNDTTITRIHIKKTEAYVEFDSEDAVDVLEFTCPDNKLTQLGDTIYDKVQPDFNWDSLSSDSSSSVQQLKEDREHFQKTEEHIVDLTEPQLPNLITISNCDVTILSNLSEKELKNTVFARFSSIQRILKKGNKIIVQFEDLGELEKLDSQFPGLKIPALGTEAFVDLDAQEVTSFSSDWIKQQKQEAPVGSSKEQKHVLHEEIIPKFQKLTSMESNFLLSQQSSGSKAQTGFQDITQHSSQHIHTKGQFPVEEGFILDDKAQRQEIFIGISNEEEQAEKKRAEQEELRRKQQQERKLFEEKQKEKEREEKQRQQRERKQKEQKERIQREKQQKQRQQREKQQRERVQREKIQRERQARQQAEKQRVEKQRLQKQKAEKERLQKQRLETQRLEKERLEKQATKKAEAERQEKQKQELEERQRIRQAIEKEQLQKKLLDQQMRIQREKQEEHRRQKKQAQQQKKKAQQAEKKRQDDQQKAKLESQKLKQQQQSRRQSQQFLLTQDQPTKPQQKTDEEVFPTIPPSSPETSNENKLVRTNPAIYWAAVLIVLFALLLI